MKIKQLAKKYALPAVLATACAASVITAFAISPAAHSMFAFAEDGTGTETTQPTTESTDIGVSMTLSDDLVMNFYAPTKYGESATVEYNGKTYSTADEGSVGLKRVAEKDTEGTYCFAFNGIAPQHMGKDVVFTVGTAETGTIKKTTSVKEYCQKLLESDEGTAVENRLLKGLAVDILNYGAAAQLYNGQDESNLVNAGISDEYATGYDDTELNNVYSIANDGGTGDVEWHSAYLDCSSKVSLCLTAEVKLDTTGKTEEEISGMLKSYTLKIDGLTSALEPSQTKDVTTSDGYTTYELTYSYDLSPLQYADALYCTIYNGGSAVSGKLTYSVHSYIDRMQDDDESIAQLTQAIFSYGKSAYAYANREEFAVNAITANPTLKETGTATVSYNVSVDEPYSYKGYSVVMPAIENSKDYYVVLYTQAGDVINAATFVWTEYKNDISINLTDTPITNYIVYNDDIYTAQFGESFGDGNQIGASYSDGTYTIPVDGNSGAEIKVVGADAVIDGNIAGNLDLSGNNATVSLSKKTVAGVITVNDNVKLNLAGSTVNGAVTVRDNASLTLDSSKVSGVNVSATEAKLSFNDVTVSGDLQILSDKTTVDLQGKNTVANVSAKELVVTGETAARLTVGSGSQPRFAVTTLRLKGGAVEVVGNSSTIQVDNFAMHGGSFTAHNTLYTDMLVVKDGTLNISVEDNAMAYAYHAGIEVLHKDDSYVQRYLLLGGTVNISRSCTTGGQIDFNSSAAFSAFVNNTEEFNSTVAYALAGNCNLNVAGFKTVYWVGYSDETYGYYGYTAKVYNYTTNYKLDGNVVDIEKNVFDPENYDPNNKFDAATGEIYGFAGNWDYWTAAGLTVTDNDTQPSSLTNKEEGLSDTEVAAEVNFEGLKINSAQN